MPRTPTDNSHATLSERDSLRVVALLENPPAAPARLVRAARAGFVLSLAVAPMLRGTESSATSAPDFCNKKGQLFQQPARVS
jgi:hypothetical protein